MQYFTLKHAKLNVSKIILGAWQWGGKKAGWDTVKTADLESFIDTAIHKGINTIDTAKVYGDSEIILGQILKPYRDKLIIATKGMGGPDKLKNILENSLRRMHLDHVDIYYIHYPVSSIPLESQIESLVALKRQGKTRAIGISNFPREKLEFALKNYPIDIVQDGLNVLWQKPLQQNLLDIYLKYDVPFIAYSPIIQGIFSHPRSTNAHILEKNIFNSEKFSQIREDLSAELAALAKKYNATPAQVLLAWVLHTKGVTGAIVGTTNKQHLIEAVSARSLHLRAGDYSRLTKFGSLTAPLIDFTKNMWDWTPP